MGLLGRDGGLLRFGLNGESCQQEPGSQTASAHYPWTEAILEALLLAATSNQSMQIQVNSNNSIDVNDETVRFAESVARDTLGRFESRLTRLEIHLNDLNSHKSGPQDKRCQIEARPNGLDPISVSEHAPTLDEAVRGAAQKMQRALDTTFGRLADKRYSNLE